MYHHPEDNHYDLIVKNTTSEKPKISKKRRRPLEDSGPLQLVEKEVSEVSENDALKIL